MWNERNILIVDSNQKVLETLKSPLEDEGYKINTATDGRSTIKIVEQGKFGVAETKEKAFRLGASRFLDKPFKRRDLFKVIKEV